MDKLTERDKHAIREVLRAWGLHHDMRRFMDCADGLAVVAHLCNAAAKFIDPEYYDFKPRLIDLVIDRHPFAWQRDGIVYVETVVGQISYHVFDGQGEELPYRCQETGPWAGGFMQDFAYEMALAYLGYGEENPHFAQWFDFALNNLQPVQRKID